MAVSVTNKVAVAMGSGLFLFMSAIYLGLVGFPSFFNNTINKNTRLKHGSDSFNRWKYLPFPLEMKVFLFNVTNPEEVRQGLARARLVEVGPYVYDEYINRTLLVNVTDDLITYNKTTLFFFNQTKSKDLRESVVVTLLNAPYMAMVITFDREFPLAVDMANDAGDKLFGSDRFLFLTRTVGEFLFSGVAMQCNKGAGELCTALKFRLPPTLTYRPNDDAIYFSFFGHKNNSADGPFTLNSGNENIMRLGETVRYRGQEELDVWPKGSPCSVIEGTEGNLFHPGITSADTISLFAPDLCLSLRAKHKRSGKRYGLMVEEFRGDPTSLMPGEDRQCLCRRDSEGGTFCLPDGLVDLTTCQGGPIIASFPHFLAGDPDLLNFVEGLAPKKDRHESFVLLEQITGVPVRGWKRIQMNVELMKIEDVDQLQNITASGVFPLFWMEEGLDLDEEMLKELRKLYIVKAGMFWGQYVIGGVGLLIAVSAIGFFLYRKKTETKRGGSPNLEGFFNKLDKTTGYLGFPGHLYPGRSPQNPQPS